MPYECRVPQLFPELFHRHPHNPILTACDWPYPAHAVFNAGACRLGDETVLLVRVEDRRGHSHLTVARSNNGVTNWRIDSQPSLAPNPRRFREETWGIEDPRLTWVDDRHEWIIAYTAYSDRGPLVSLAATKDFSSFTRLGPVMPPDDKDAAVFPGKLQPLRHDTSPGFDGQFRRTHVAFLLARPGSLGRSPRPAACPERCLVGCEQNRLEPTAAGDSRRVVDRVSRRASHRRGMSLSPRFGAYSTWKTRGACCGAATSGFLRPSNPTNARGTSTASCFRVAGYWTRRVERSTCITAAQIPVWRWPPHSLTICSTTSAAIPLRRPCQMPSRR